MLINAKRKIYSFIAYIRIGRGKKKKKKIWVYFCFWEDIINLLLPILPMRNN